MPRLTELPEDSVEECSMHSLGRHMCACKQCRSARLVPMPFTAFHMLALSLLQSISVQSTLQMQSAQNCFHKHVAAGSPSLLLKVMQGQPNSPLWTPAMCDCSPGMQISVPQSPTSAQTVPPAAQGVLDLLAALLCNPWPAAALSQQSTSASSGKTQL